jgi:hypothetical protein
VPTPKGDLQVYCNQQQIKITTNEQGIGVLKFKSKTQPVCKEGQLVLKANQAYEMVLEKGKTYLVAYTAM